MAYQGHAGKMNLALINRLNKEATFGVMPDLLIILDVPPEKGLKMEQDADRFAAKGLSYHTDVNNGYLAVARKHSNISVIVQYRDGDVAGMQKEIRKHIVDRFGKLFDLKL